MSRQSKLPPPPIKTRTGIVGIERGIQEKQRATDASISQAFQDLNKLMGMAKEMVHISRSISTKIKEKQGDITEDETIRFKSYLLSMGIEDPVTRDSYRSTDQYHTNLAKQISQVLYEPIKEVGGMMALTDAYCRINRARGFELLSPEDLLEACKLLEQLELPIILRRFDSNVYVLQLSSHNDMAIIEKTSEFIKNNGMVTAVQLAQELGISVTLAHERLITTEKHGFAVRDDAINGLMFYYNLFLHGTAELISQYQSHLGQTHQTYFKFLSTMNEVQESESSNSVETSRASTPTNPCPGEKNSLVTEESVKEKVYKFKDPKYQRNSLASKSPPKKKIWKSLKQIIAQERALPWGDNFVHYNTINAPPSFKPAKKYSDISGLPSYYVDPQTKLQYSTPEEFQTIRSLPSDIISGYLALRRANNPIP